VSVDMTSTVKRHDERCRACRLFAVEGSPRRSTSASRDVFGGDIDIAPPLPIVDCRPSTAQFFSAARPRPPRAQWQGARAQPHEGRDGGGRGRKACASWEGPPWSGRHTRACGETEPVTTTVAHADIRGLVTTLRVSVTAPASLSGRGLKPRNALEDYADTGAAPPPRARASTTRMLVVE
jgi:hypothetical protein